MTTGQRVVVAMSGGVDSSVAAALLVQQGYQVIGMMLRLWSEPGREGYNRCCTPDSMALARRVAARLDIPFYTIDAQAIFYDVVVTPFMDGYLRGETPNPCLWCNRVIRWEFLLNHARAIGADCMATGHYARLRKDPNRPIELLRGIDQEKDQSYVLHVLNQEQLRSAIFPLGELTKSQVRQIARQLELPASEKKDSQDLCFLGGEDYRTFLARNKPSSLNPGPIIHVSGRILGQHHGLAFYTIGQRKGIGVGAAQPLYVLAKDLSRNALIVGEEEFLGTSEIIVHQVNWIAGTPPPQPLRLSVKIRYKADFAWAKVTPLENGQALVQFEKKIRDITPGQAAVFYEDQVCLGGGIILGDEVTKGKQ